MKNKFLLLALGLFMSGQAAAVSSINWDGTVQISGLGVPNPTNLSILYNITGGSHTIGASSPSEVVTGALVINDFFAPGLNLTLNEPAFITHIAEHGTMILPTGTVNFPNPGVVPTINLNPNFATNVSSMFAGINTDITVTKDFFSGSTFLEEITITANHGQDLGLLFKSLDANGDGQITRPFNLDIEISPVPVPAAAWLFISGFMGMIAMRRKVVA